MEIKLTKDQYAQLMRLVYLGNWVVNGFHTDDIDEESDALEDYVYSKARDFGLEKITYYDEDQNAWYPKTSTRTSGSRTSMNTRTTPSGTSSSTGWPTATWWPATARVRSRG